MPNRSLSYRIEFDTRTAVRDLQRLTREGKRAGEEIADGFDSTETAGTNALRALTRQLDTLETNAKGTAQAAEAIGRSMGEGFDTAKVTRFVSDLNRIGVGFDEIEQRAEEFAAVLRRVDDTDLSNTRQELNQLDDGLDRVRNNSDQSRSVLANLAGNSAQSLGELGGVVGDLGVGIGQLVEYSVDGNIALSNLAKVAGPMAALSAAGLLVTKVFGDMAKAREAARERVETFTEALEDGTDAWATFREQAAETGELEFIEDGLFGIGDSVDNLIPDLARLGFTFEQFQAIATNPAAREEMQKLLDLWVDQRGAIDPTVVSLGNVIAAADQYADSSADATEAQARLNAVLGPTPATLEQVGEALSNSGDALDDWTQRVADARDEIAGILAEEMDLSGALSAAFDAGDVTLDFQAAKGAVDDVFEELQAHVDAHGPIDYAALLDMSQLDPSQINMDEVGLLQRVRDTFQDGIQQAFDLGGIDTAQMFTDAFLPQLAASGGPESSLALYRFLGLDANGNVAVTLQPYIDAQAAAGATRILDAIAGTDLADQRVAQIQIAIEQGQIEGEIANLAAQIAAADVGLAIYPTVDENTTQVEIDAAQAWLDDHTVTVGTEADTAGAEREIHGFTSRRRVATIDAKTAASVGTTARDLDDAARDRTSTVDAQLTQQLVAGMILDAYLTHVARPRTVSIGVEVTGLQTANALIDQAARDRTSTIVVDANAYAVQRAIATAISNAMRLGRIAS